MGERKVNDMVKLKSKWFKGNVFSMSLRQFMKIKKYEKGVKSPSAFEIKKVGRRYYSRFIYKPIRPGELD